jgi:hypothetical protein
MLVACRDVPACAVPDEYRSASIHAAAQKDDSRANFRFHPGHPGGACKVFPVRRAGWGALAGRDVARRRCVARFPASFQELARDYPLGAVEKVRSDVLRARQTMQPPGAQKVVGRQRERLGVILRAPLASPQRNLPRAAPLVPEDESESPQGLSLQARGAQLASQQAELRPASQRPILAFQKHPELAFSEHQVPWSAPSMPEQLEPVLERPASRQALWETQ